MNREGYLQTTRLQWHSSQSVQQSQYMQENDKALIGSGAAISLIRYSTYQSIDSSFKTPIQATTTKLNTADGSLMMALGMTALHFRPPDFKLPHTFIIYNRLPDIEILFGVNIQKQISLSYAWDMEKNCYIQKGSRFLTLETVNRRQQ